MKWIDRERARFRVEQLGTESFAGSQAFRICKADSRNFGSTSAPAKAQVIIICPITRPKTSRAMTHVH